MLTLARQTSPRVRLLSSVAAVLLVCALVLALATRAWAEEYLAGERMLPGVTVAAVGVGDLPVEDARSEVEAEFERRLDAELIVRDGDRTWTTTPRELGARVDVGDALSSATQASAETGWAQLTAVRWAGTEASIDVEATPTTDEDAVAAFVDDLADDVRTDPIPATARWRSSGAEVVEDVDGRSVDREEAAEALAAAVEAGEDSVALPTREDEAVIRADDVEALLPALDDAFARTTERELTVTDTHETWEVPVDGLVERPDLSDAVVTAADLAADGHDTDEIAEALTPLPLDADDDGVEEALDGLADEVALDAVNAGMDYSTGWVELTPSKQGRELNHEGAAEAFAAALREGDDAVELPTDAVEPQRTRSDYRDVVLVRKNDRRVYHYRDGEVVADWPAAIGTDEQPTPTGVFTIGAKRHMPSWHNPAPDRWGKDMPEVIEPGPSNPLGVRALNWNRDGRDTLIRFHGTANVDSIGRASSNGCVRLSNSDVVELYERIPSGTRVVSVNG